MIVPHRAFSAATSIALGADEIIMYPMGMLGPTDPTVMNAFNAQNPRNPNELLGISVEDVSAYIKLIKECNLRSDHRMPSTSWSGTRRGRRTPIFVDFIKDMDGVWRIDSM